jgi:hypothetical protein
LEEILTDEEPHESKPELPSNDEPESNHVESDGDESNSLVLCTRRYPRWHAGTNTVSCDLKDVAFIVKSNVVALVSDTNGDMHCVVSTSPCLVRTGSHSPNVRSHQFQYRISGAPNRMMSFDSGTCNQKINDAPNIDTKS